MTAELLRYEKLASDLEGMIASGMLRHGDRLPSLRRLSRERRLVGVDRGAGAYASSKIAVWSRRGRNPAISCAGRYRHGPSRHSVRRRRLAVPVDVTQRLVRVLQAGMQAARRAVGGGVAASFFAAGGGAATPLRRRCPASPEIARRRQPHQHGRTGAGSPDSCAVRWPGAGRWPAMRSSSPIRVPRRLASACALSPGRAIRWPSSRRPIT